MLALAARRVQTETIHEQKGDDTPEQSEGTHSTKAKQLCSKANNSGSAPRLGRRFHLEEAEDDASAAASDEATGYRQRCWSRKILDLLTAAANRKPWQSRLVLLLLLVYLNLGTGTGTGT